MTRTRDRFQNAKNRRKQVFEVFTSRVSSQFERVEMKIVIINNKKISAKIERIIRQADSISRREREQEREQERERQEREQERERTRDTRDRDRFRTVRNENEIAVKNENKIAVKNENENDEIKDVLAAK